MLRQTSVNGSTYSFFEKPTRAVKGSSMRFPISRMPKSAQTTTAITGSVPHPKTCTKASGRVET